MIISGFGDPELRAKRARLGLAGTQTQIGTDRPGLGKRAGSSMVRRYWAVGVPTPGPG